MRSPFTGRPCSVPDREIVANGSDQLSQRSPPTTTVDSRLSAARRRRRVGLSVRRLPEMKSARKEKCLARCRARHLKRSELLDPGEDGLQKIEQCRIINDGRPQCCIHEIHTLLRQLGSTSSTVRGHSVTRLAKIRSESRYPGAYTVDGAKSRRAATRKSSRYSMLLRVMACVASSNRFTVSRSGRTLRR